MSYSTLKINKTSYRECTTKLDYDTYDIHAIIKTMIDEKEIKAKVIRNIYLRGHECYHGYISNICIVEEFDGFLKTDTIIYVSYHHSNDPSMYDVVCNVYEILKEEDYD